MPGRDKKTTIKGRDDLDYQVVFSSFEREGRNESEHPFIFACGKPNAVGAFEVVAFFGTSDKQGRRHQDPGRHYTLKKKDYPFLKFDTYFDTCDVYFSASSELLGLRIKVAGSVREKHMSELIEKARKNMEEGRSRKRHVSFRLAGQDMEQEW